MNFFALIKKELKESIRSRRLYVLTLIFTFFGIVSPLAARYMPDIVESMTRSQNIKIELPSPTWMDAVGQYIKNISQVCSFILIFFIMGVVAREKEKGTAIFVLVKPVSRTYFLLAKFISSWLNVLVALFFSMIFSIFYTMLFFENLPLYNFIYQNFLLLLNLLVLVSFTIFYSAIARSQLIAGILSFLTWIAFSISAQFGKPGEFSPSRLISESSMLVKPAYVVSWEPVAGAIAVILASILFSIVIFRKIELSE